MIVVWQNVPESIEVFEISEEAGEKYISINNKYINDVRVSDEERELINEFYDNHQNYKVEFEKTPHVCFGTNSIVFTGIYL